MADSGLNKVAKQWEPIECCFENPGFEGNPYELNPEATFLHEGSGEKRTTGLFHTGQGSTWAVRFTGTRPGKWSFTTTSRAGALDSKCGSVTVQANPDARGFVTGFGRKWGWSATGEVFVPQLVMYRTPDEYHNRPDLIDADIETFLVGHGFNGFHTVVGCRWFDIDKAMATKFDTADPSPDQRTFEALELLISRTYAAGAMVHIWVWGDDDADHRMTPISLGGKNGLPDMRLQRYIAARLGPLPGWTMGYGFDLEHWTKAEDLRVWHTNMHKLLGWPHVLGGRQLKPKRYRGEVTDPPIYEGLDYAGYDQKRPGYQDYVEAIESGPDKPGLSEDRFRIRDSERHRAKDYDMVMTRRGLWHSAMAGGVGNIWGYFLPPGTGGASDPYPREDWIKTNATFFARRFAKDMVRLNEVTDGLCLKRPTNRHYLIYKEDAGTIRMDLSDMGGAQRGVAVDAVKPYAEIDLGELLPAERTWRAPYVSDWAIAVGDFEDLREESPARNDG